MATAAERAHQHALAADAMERFRWKVDAFRRPPRTGSLPSPAVRQPPAAPAQPPRPSSAPIAQELIANVPWWQPAVRREARRQAERIADERHAALLRQFEQRKAVHVSELRRLDKEERSERRLLNLARRRLAESDPRAVGHAVRVALTSLPVPVGRVALDGDRAFVSAVVPPLAEVVPEREPARTSTGKPSTRKLGVGERNELYAELVCGTTLAAAAYALAAAPSLSTASAVVAAGPQNDSHAAAYCMLHRADVARLISSWRDVIEAFFDCDGHFEERGRTRAVQPLDAERHPELAAMLDRLTRSERTPA